MGNRYTCKQTFEEWCLINNRQDILDLWDYDKNDCSPADVPVGTKKKYYFQCANGIHDSYDRRIDRITKNSDHILICKQCEDEGLYKKDLTGMVLGDLTVLYLDEEKSKNKNKIDYWFCKCSCGNIVSVSAYKLNSGKKSICGKANKHKKKENSEILNDLRRTPEYYQFRKNVIIKDNAKCIITGKRPKDIEVHHIYSYALYPDDRFNPDHAVCISKEYHCCYIPGSFHYIYGKNDTTPEQFQDYVNMKRKEIGNNEFFDVYKYMEQNRAE